MMPRQSLREISANSNYRGGVRGRFELTSYWHSHIVGRAAAGQSQKDIAKALNIPALTIQYTVAQAKNRYENETLHRSGRPKIVDEHLHCRLLREVRTNSKI